MQDDRRISPCLHRNEILRPFGAQNDKNAGGHEGRPYARHVVGPRSLVGLRARRGEPLLAQFLALFAGQGAGQPWQA